MRSLRTLAIAAITATTALTACAQTESEPEPAREWPDYVYATMSTNKGDMVIELDHANAPITVENFVQYIEDGHYKDTVFHRLTKGGIFVIQGGGFTTGGVQKQTRAAIKNESTNGLSNVRGTLSMARTPVVDSATSQFFINVKDNSAILDRSNRGAGYAVFGEIIEGLDVMDALHATPIEGGVRDGKPEEQILITEVTLFEDEANTSMMEERAAERKRMADEQASAEEARWESALAEAKETLAAREFDVESGYFDEETGLWMLVIEEGEGKTPAPTDGITAHTTGWLTDGTKFWSSYDGAGDALQMRLNQFIQGWVKGVGKMKAGGKRILVIPAEMAYGEQERRDPSGTRVVIPANSTLIFEVELIEVQ